MVKRSALSMQMADFANRYYASWLEEQGFISRRNNRIHWYRIVGEDIVQSVFFCNMMNNSKVFLPAIHYQMAPLFFRPEYCGGAICDLLGKAMWYRYVPPQKNTNHFSMQDGFFQLVDPNDQDVDIEPFVDLMLPLWARTQTVSDCFTLHMEEVERLNQIPTNTTDTGLEVELIEEMIWLQDVSKYPRAQKRLYLEIEILYRAMGQWKPQCGTYRYFAERLLLCKKLLEVLSSGDSESYVELLRQRQEQNRTELIKKVGIGQLPK